MAVFVSTRGLPATICIYASVAAAVLAARARRRRCRARARAPSGTRSARMASRSARYAAEVRSSAHGDDASAVSSHVAAAAPGELTALASCSCSSWTMRSAGRWSGSISPPSWVHLMMRFRTRPSLYFAWIRTNLTQVTVKWVSTTNNLSLDFRPADIKPDVYYKITELYEKN